MELRRRSKQISITSKELLVGFPQPPPAAPVAPLQQQQRRLPNQVGRALRVPLDPGQNSGAVAPTIDASVAPAAAAKEDIYEGDYEDEVDQNQNYVQPPTPPPPGRPHAYHRNSRAAPPPEVHDHLPKLKLNIPPFEGRYVPDIYLTWELETKQ